MTRPLLLGHRGARASRHIPENTLESFEFCLQHGCDGFEFDVRRSADGQAVICHDAVTRGMTIAKTSAAALGLPSLDEVLSSFGRRAFLDIELKVAGLEQQTVGLLREYSSSNEYVVSSFKLEVLTALRGFDPTIPLGFICDRDDDLDQWRDLPVAWVISRIQLVNPSLVKQVQSAGKKIMVWTVNGPFQLRRLAELGVDAIVSDNTELAARILAKL
jgi:glycerophosphoryl diester phosphodiesterase